MKRNKKYTKIALALSLFLLIMWGVMGTGTSLAWFSETTPLQKNIFHIGELDMLVSYKNEAGVYEKVEMDTVVFNEDALYEPGYVQVVYFEVKNKGDMAFDYKTAVTVNSYVPAVNVFGNVFNLQDYLQFGVVMADTEAELNSIIGTRDDAELNALLDMPINTYSTDIDTLEPGETAYMAVIVRMPKEVGNVANFRGDTPPEVHLGIIFNASQKGTLQQ